MRYGKVVNDKIVNWLDIDPNDDLKIQKATNRNYRPEEDIVPVISEYEVLRFIGHDIQEKKLVKQYQIDMKPQSEIDLIDARKQREIDIQAAIDGMQKVEDVRNFLIKYWK